MLTPPASRARPTQTMPSCRWLQGESPSTTTCYRTPSIRRRWQTEARAMAPPLSPTTCTKHSKSSQASDLIREKAVLARRRDRNQEDSQLRVHRPHSRDRIQASNPTSMEANSYRPIPLTSDTTMPAAVLVCLRRCQRSNSIHQTCLQGFKRYPRHRSRQPHRILGRRHRLPTPSMAAE